MKKIITTLVLAGLYTSSLRAQSGIHIQNGTYYQSYVYAKDSIYIGVSNQGSGNFKRMALVNPATKEWKYINTTDFSGYFGPFVMKNNMQGVMYDQGNGNMYYTGDGWQTRQTLSGVATMNQLALSGSGYVGYNATIHNLYYSADGQNWSNITSVPTPGSGGIKLAALNNKVMLFYQFASSYISTDGGQTYSTVSYSNSFSGTFVDFTMYTEDTLFVLTSSALHKTTDNGTNWTNTPTPNTGTYSLRGLLVKNANEIYVWDSGENIYYSPDGGTTWQTKTPLNPLANIEKMMVINNYLFAWPSARSSDGGTTWEDLLPGGQINYAKGNDIHFKGNIGLSASTTGRISISKDKGRSFVVPDTIQGAGDITAVKILGNGDFLASDAQGKVFYSTDMGATWTKNYNNTTNISTYKVTSSSDENTILLTRSSYPLVSTDHGTTWTVVTTNGGSHSQTLKPNGDILDVVGWFNYTTFQVQGWQISKYTPSGTSTVIDTFLASNETLIDIYMTSDNIGYLFSTDNTSKATKIYKTTNGFNGGTALTGTMLPVNTGAANYTLGKTRIQSFGTDTLFLVGDGNKFYHYSYDGGATWNVVTESFCTTYANNYPSVKKGYFFNRDEYILTLGNGGWYLNINESGSSLNGIQQYGTSLINGLDEMKIYPNPASSVVHLLTEKNIKQVLVSDLLGKQIINIENTNVFNISHLPEGIYIVNILTENDLWYKQKLVIAH